MYETHPAFYPPDNHAVIWRYMSFAKFASLLERKALFFARLDRLGDPFESAIPRHDMELMLRGDFFASIANESERAEAIASEIRQLHSHLAVNCWHISEHESAAMWQLYSAHEEGIAIQSTFSRLEQCFSQVARPVFIGVVRYIDYDCDSALKSTGGRLNTFAWVTHKRQSFEHERELRAVISLESGATLQSGEEFLDGEGVYVSVDINTLIEKVYVSPTSPGWFAGLVQSTARRFELAKDVTRSDLLESPIY